MRLCRINQSISYHRSPLQFTPQQGNFSNFQSQNFGFSRNLHERPQFSNRNLPTRHGSHGHHHTPLTGNDAETKTAMRITWIGLGSNVLLAIGKGIAGVVGNSAAMVSDAAHSVSDTLSDFVTLAAVKLSRKPVDKDHPYGRGKYESLGAFAVGGLLVFTGIGIGHHSLEHLMSPEVPTQLAAWAAVIAVVSKEVLFRVTLNIGKQQHSQVLIANAWHHRSDSISSLLALGGIIGSQMGLAILDPVAGLVVCGLIVKMGFTSMLSATKELTDSLQDPSIVFKIESFCKTLEGVSDCSNVRARHMGPYLLVDMHVQVDPTTSVSVGHQTAERVRLSVLNQFPRVTEVLVHVNAEPDQPGSEKLMRPQSAIIGDIKNALEMIPNIKQTSHVLLHFLKNRLHVEVTISVDENITVKEAKTIANHARSRIETISDVTTADVHLELSENHKVLEEIKK